MVRQRMTCQRGSGSVLLPRNSSSAGLVERPPPVQTIDFLAERRRVLCGLLSATNTAAASPSSLPFQFHPCWDSDHHPHQSTIALLSFSSIVRPLTLLCERGSHIIHPSYSSRRRKKKQQHMAASVSFSRVRALPTWSSSVSGSGEEQQSYYVVAMSARPRRSSARPLRSPAQMMGNVNAGKGVFAPLVVVARNIIGRKRFNQLRGKAIALHSQVITEFCKTIGADAKQRQGLIRLAKKNGEKLGFLA